ncbi:MAG: DUF4382 domain-containing protein, partial [Candidatus Neomarinimicrobiota bacterium]
MNKIFLLFLITGFITSCGDTEKKTGKGTLSIEIADDPFPSDLVDSANVVVSEIKIRGADSTLTLTQIPQEINLLDLRNGVTANLVTLEIPANTYDRVSLIISRAWIKMKDGTEYSLKIPSGAQTGLKINIDPAIVVESGLTSDLLLDFDVSKSFVVQGNINTPAGIKGFIFKPVLRAQNLSFAGSLSGIVLDTLSQAIGNALVWIEQDSVISFTLADSISGAYSILGLPP